VRALGPQAHRPLLLFRAPQLSVIDGQPVSDEERAYAQALLAMQTGLTGMQQGAMAGAGAGPATAAQLQQLRELLAGSGVAALPDRLGLWGGGGGGGGAGALGLKVRHAWKPGTACPSRGRLAVGREGMCGGRQVLCWRAVPHDDPRL
jgi:hypothetical protein